MAEYDIAVIGGDGIGPEVTREALRVLDAAAKVFGFKIRRTEYPFGTNHYLKTQEIFPESAFSEVRQKQAIFLGAIGDPRVPVGLIEYGVIAKCRFELDLYINLRQSDEVFELYGTSARTPGTYAANCLLARRLLERGVRCVQLFHQGWDQHGGLPAGITTQCGQTDQASAALVSDLKQRGLLDDTLVVWGGEFGRTAYCQGKLTPSDYGRDHHPRCFSIWLAGGGVKAGYVHGKTDEYGYNILEGAVDVHDLHATMLKLLGLDHEQLVFKSQGRYFRLTDVFGKVVPEILA